jgi:hypothetical protein
VPRRVPFPRSGISQNSKPSSAIEHSKILGCIVHPFF